MILRRVTPLRRAHCTHYLTLPRLPTHACCARRTTSSVHRYRSPTPSLPLFCNSSVDFLLLFISSVLVGAARGGRLANASPAHRNKGKTAYQHHLSAHSAFRPQRRTCGATALHRNSLLLHTLPAPQHAPRCLRAEKLQRPLLLPCARSATARLMRTYALTRATLRITFAASFLHLHNAVIMAGTWQARLPTYCGGDSIV